ncbi:exonuclease domain-containing protein [Tenacibaculum piscium]|uniref:DNA polymerase III subunit epsilon n=1 Tax=Tenacibaculum piscium TaxID=1458515 RepID=A0A2H1YGP1_9FLAO|nr:exonuclease domain-containing protein [Tenacibaculum piscium]MBE7630265.1 DNA polymerase III subunit epsilon [Tenacibaculum piscium]MBE7670876.1 DNA polymerase III subunit epsilon [Tenacibaculum piscium]MBE7685716.1 DNA polymerase III subunit epsilon [Tenacibaculum piscium]MBE7690293.1 DNA polymerase III subunit epsilon [Tenacibaculum piscium]MCG8184055.1 DNA polymerase III subunit epsilon [Tenacibaculum piscium]
MYAILDIETTGGKFNEEGITEIAIHKFDGHQVVDQFISLVNPEREIQEFVVKLTGINSNMLRNSPKFYEVAKRIIEITKDCIIIAHNASFDYRILRTEFDRLGFDYQRNTICTVALSKKLIPEAPSHSLGKLCRFVGIPMSDRHRANGDALATIQLFKLLLEKDIDKNIVQQSIKYADNRHIKQRYLKLLEKSPEKEGLFYVHNQQGTIIFIGRGQNIKKEVNKLFLKESPKGVNILKRIHEITFQETGNLLFTRLKYHLELLKLRPKYNVIRKPKISGKHFNHDTFLILDKGRSPEENAVILIEKNTVLGYTYTNLAFQENNLSVLKSMLTPIENREIAKTIIKNYLLKNNVSKIVRLEIE